MFIKLITQIYYTLNFLKKLKNPPKTLYIKGEYDFLSSNPSVAIIGTRTQLMIVLKRL